MPVILKPLESSHKRIIPCPFLPGGVSPVKLEKQKILLLLFFSVVVFLLVLLCTYDPYAGKGSHDDFMNLILSRMGLAPLGNGF